MTPQILSEQTKEYLNTIGPDTWERFLLFIGKANALPKMEKRSRNESRSLYEVVSKDRDAKTLEKELENFFGQPAKPTGKSVPLTLRFNATYKYLGGIRKEQSLFVKKTGPGEFYGALWPWQSSPENITMHLGYYSDSMPVEVFAELAGIIDAVCNKNLTGQE